MDSDERMSSKTVKVVADLGGNTLFDAGHCHPSQARILVKKNLAAWKDGVLHVNFRPVHLAVAANTDRLPSEERDDNISKAELTRRQNWLRSIITAVINSDTHGSDFGTALGVGLSEVRQPEPREGLEHVLKSSAKILIDADAGLRSIHGSTPEVEVRDSLDEKHEPRDPADDDWYKEDHKLPKKPDDELEELWETASDVSKVFGVPSIVDNGESFRLPWQADRRCKQPLKGPVYTPEEAKDGGIVRLTVPFWGRRRGFPGPTGPVRIHEGMPAPEKRKCPTCGQGYDTDGDGNCPSCITYLGIETR